MPAQWPIFINNLSQKLASRTSKGPDDIGMFVANEYFNAVKTSQTPFGNIHKSGQKAILETGFKKAFNMLFKSLEPQLEDKFGNPPYDDMFENLPGVDLSVNPDCDFQEWTIKNKQTIEPFEFYPLFPTTCIIPKPIVPPTNLYGDIDITSENVDSQPELRYVTMSVEGGGGTFPYEFTYSLNGVIQPTLTSDSQGVVKFLAPTDVGKYDYTFISAIDASKREEIKNIDRSASIEIKKDPKAVDIKVDPPKPFPLVKPMTEAQQIDELANRVYYQNDGTEEYLDWVERLPYHGELARKISKKVLTLLDTETNEIKKSTGIVGIPQANSGAAIITSNRDYYNQIDLIKETIRKAQDKLNKLNAADPPPVTNRLGDVVSNNNQSKPKVDPIEKAYARVEVLQAEILLEKTEIAAYQRWTSNYTVDSYRTNRIENLTKELSVELQIINVETLRKNLNEIKDVNSIDYIMAKVRLYQNELTIATYKKDDRKIDSLNRELTVQALRVIKLKNKIKKEAATNDRLFQEEYDDRPDIMPTFITSNFICIFTYVNGIDDNQKSAPDKNPLIALTTSTSSSGYSNNTFGSTWGNSKPETYSEWSRRTEPGRIRAKATRYELEKVRYRELKIRHINQIAEDNKKAGNLCGADDAYCVMSKCIIDYWKSTAAQPFAKSPPILPCLIPDPGSYIPVYYGDEAKLGADLRRAWNTGKRFKMEPTLQTATKAVATAVAVSCARHLLDLKFIYSGKIPAGTGTAPMIGFSPLAL